MRTQPTAPNPDSAEPDTYWAARPSLARPGYSRLGGRGLFALVPIAAGTLIDRACSIEIDAEQTVPLDAMQPLGDFYFEHPADKRAGLMALGLMSLCNHADDPNADIRWQWQPDIGWIASLVSLRPIAAGEEITYRYKCALWFPKQV